MVYTRRIQLLQTTYFGIMHSVSVMVDPKTAIVHMLVLGGLGMYPLRLGRTSPLKKTASKGDSCFSQMRHIYR